MINDKLANDCWYDGDWWKGKRFGMGVTYDDNGDIIYKGIYINDIEMHNIQAYSINTIDNTQHRPTDDVPALSSPLFSVSPSRGFRTSATFTTHLQCLHFALRCE